MAAPDVFHRTGTWLSFGYDQFTETRPHTSALNEDLVVDDMQAALDFLAAQPDVDPTRIGVVGYCFGGRASLVAAIRMPQVIKAAAIFYGRGIVADSPAAPVNRVGEVRGTAFAAMPARRITRGRRRMRGIERWGSSAPIWGLCRRLRGNKKEAGCWGAPPLLLLIAVNE